MPMLVKCKHCNIMQGGMCRLDVGGVVNPKRPIVGPPKASPSSRSAS